MAQMTETAAAQAEQTYRVAPKGFTPELLETFVRDGFAILDVRLSDDELAYYREAAQEVFAKADNCARPHGGPFDPMKTNKIMNVCPMHPAFSDLIDHDRHIGYAYDIFGEQTKLIQAELFYRPGEQSPDSSQNWHLDGPRAVPYKAFAPELPLKLRISYWLTDFPERNRGNFVYVPGSHLPEYRKEHLGLAPDPREVPLMVEAWTITIANGGIWHRVEPNLGPEARTTIFMSYSPSWVVGYYGYDPEWLQTLTREQRILLRAYDDDQEAYSRPPAEDYPLFLDRETHSDRELNGFLEEERHKWRRYTMWEKMQHAKRVAAGAEIIGV